MTQSLTPDQMTDNLPRPSSGSYVAERHALLPEYIVVWAPCGCFWLGNNLGSRVTACATPACDFQWPAVKAALEAFHLLEQSLNTPTEPANLGIHPVASADAISGTEEPNGAQEMISEGGPVDSSL